MPKFKVGDIVRCIDIGDGIKHYEGAGWSKDKIFKINFLREANTTGDKKYFYTYFPFDGAGVYEGWLELISRQNHVIKFILNKGDEKKELCS